jgi:MFS family permease
MRLKRLSLLFFLITFIIGTDTFLVSPLLPTLTQYYGIPEHLSGFIVSAYALGYTLSAIVVGPISDRHDRRRILLIGLLIFAGATALGGLANTYPMMLAARFLAGLAAACAGPQIWAAIPLLFPKDQVVKMMGYVSAGLAVAQIVGVPLGSFLAAVSWRFPFFFVGTIALLLTLLSARYLPSLSSADDHESNRGVPPSLAQSAGGQAALCLFPVPDGQFLRLRVHWHLVCQKLRLIRFPDRQFDAGHRDRPIHRQPVKQPLRALADAAPGIRPGISALHHWLHHLASGARGLGGGIDSGVHLLDRRGHIPAVHVHLAGPSR